MGFRAPLKKKNSSFLKFSNPTVFQQIMLACQNEPFSSTHFPPVFERFLVYHITKFFYYSKETSQFPCNLGALLLNLRGLYNQTFCPTLNSTCLALRSYWTFTREDFNDNFFSPNISINLFNFLS